MADIIKASSEIFRCRPVVTLGCVRVPRYRGSQPGSRLSNSALKVPNIFTVIGTKFVALNSPLGRMRNWNIGRDYSPEGEARCRATSQAWHGPFCADQSSNLLSEIFVFSASTLDSQSAIAGAIGVVGH